jgi:hypothetical protein
MLRVSLAGGDDPIAVNTDLKHPAVTTRPGVGTSNTVGRRVECPGQENRDRQGGHESDRGERREPPWQ